MRIIIMRNTILKKVEMNIYIKQLNKMRKILRLNIYIRLNNKILNIKNIIILKFKII